jgi:DNA-directed RNA polymerase specialized sigma24 family protein
MVDSIPDSAETLQKILRLLLVLATKDMKQRDQIALLDRASFKPKEIAGLLGTSSNTVRVELVALRKAGKRKH